MDERRFDTWTRAVARPGSRRRVLRALLGGGAVLAAARRGRADAAAHHGMAGPGDPCRTDSQCVAADAPMACDWNGYGNGLAAAPTRGATAPMTPGAAGQTSAAAGRARVSPRGARGQAVPATKARTMPTPVIRDWFAA